MDRSTLNQAVMLNWLGQQPVSFHRSYVDITGSVVAALWLSNAMDKMVVAGTGSVDPDDNYTFVMTGQQCEQDTGITRSQQSTCRRLLIQQGLLSEDSQKGKVVRYCIYLDRLAQRLLQQAGPLAAALDTSASDNSSAPTALQHSA